MALLELDAKVQGYTIIRRLESKREQQTSRLVQDE